MVRPSALFLAAASSILWLASPALAVNAGHLVSCAIGGGSTFVCQNAATATVGAGMEFLIGFDPVARPDNPEPYLAADFADGLLTIHSLRNNDLALTILEFRNLTTPFVAFEWLGTSGFAPQSGGLPIGPERVSLADGLLSVDLRLTTNGQDGFIRLGLVSAPPGAVVPEPKAWAMLIAGFGLVGAALRRPRRAAA
jgi:hypothetical protein